MGMPARSTVLDEPFERPATPRVVDFTGVRDVYLARDERGLMQNVNRAGYLMDEGITTESTDYVEPMKNSPEKGLSATTKQQRARARRRLKKGIKVSDEAWNRLYKPIEEWDAEELARGRPRNANGNFQGRPPAYITRELHEKALERFKLIVREDMNVHSIAALKTVQMILEDEEVDDKGKPRVPASTKLDAAKFLIEHVVGKAVQPTTSDISVKLQGILAAVMVNPQEIDTTAYQPAHMGARELTGEVYDAEEVDEDELDG